MLLVGAFLIYLCCTFLCILYQIFEKHILTRLNSIHHFNICIEEFSKLFKQIEVYSNLHIPDEFEIGRDNLPKDKNAAHNWGNTFTLYKTARGAKLHTKYNCCSAVIPVHVFWYRSNYRISTSLCMRCAYNNNFPVMYWYDDYLKYEQSKETLKELQKEMEILHKKM